MAVFFWALLDNGNSVLRGTDAVSQVSKDFLAFFIKNSSRTLASWARMSANFAGALAVRTSLFQC
jgi:hypothetical protein